MLNPEKTGISLINQPFKDPIMIPFTKYLCRNGYAITIGNAVITIVVSRTDVELTVNVET